MRSRHFGCLHNQNNEFYLHLKNSNVKLIKNKREKTFSQNEINRIKSVTFVRTSRALGQRGDNSNEKCSHATLKCAQKSFQQSAVVLSKSEKNNNNNNNDRAGNDDPFLHSLMTFYV